MQFRDRTLVRLSDPATRGAVFDERALEQILSAAYDTQVLPTNAPFTAVFDQFRIGFAELYSVHGEGQLYGAHGEAGRLALTLADWQPGQTIQADAFWRGSVIARSAPDDSIIESLDLGWAALPQIDVAVASANGGVLPTDSETLEAARRAQLAEILQNRMQSPEALDDARLDRLLHDFGVSGASELLSAANVRPANLGVAFSAPAGIPPSPRRYPIAAALLVRDQGFGLADLLLESKLLRHRLAEAGVEAPRPPSLPVRQPLLVIWVVPGEVFDDDDWPGGDAGMNADQRRAARRARAGQWLAREGIGLAVAAG
jgi:hypothetical protein